MILMLSIQKIARNIFINFKSHLTLPIKKKAKHKEYLKKKKVDYLILHQKLYFVMENKRIETYTI